MSLLADICNIISGPNKIQYNLTIKNVFFFLALPPPVPPRVEPLFQPLVSLLQCDIMVHIMHLVLQRTVAVRSRSWSEAQVDRVCI